MIYLIQKKFQWVGLSYSMQLALPGNCLAILQKLFTAFHMILLMILLNSLVLSCRSLAENTPVK